MCIRDRGAYSAVSTWIETGSYTYDAFGNRISETQYAYSFEAGNNQLHKQVEYVYDKAKMCIRDRSTDPFKSEEYAYRTKSSAYWVLMKQNVAQEETVAVAFEDQRIAFSPIHQMDLAQTAPITTQTPRLEEEVVQQEERTKQEPVSYTHLDVYKRQQHLFTPVPLGGKGWRQAADFADGAPGCGAHLARHREGLGAPAVFRSNCGRMRVGARRDRHEEYAHRAV